MTAAAARYNTVSGMGGVSPLHGKKSMFGFGPAYNRAGRLPGDVYQASNGRWMKVLPTGATQFISGKSGAVKWAKFGQFAGKASPWAALGGMGLQMAAGAVGEDTGAGRVMNVAGGALGWAGTGAMLGSVIPGIGTAAGAIVGGVS